MLFLGRNKKSGKDSTISSEKLLKTEEAAAVQTSEEEIETALSIMPGWMDSPEKEYVLRFLNNQCQPLKPNQISLSGIEWNEDADGRLTATAFVRSSLSKAITFDEVPILLIDADGELLARGMFDLSLLGELPPKSSRPWHFEFVIEERLSTKQPSEGWKLAFELKQQHSLDLAKSWEQSMAEEDKEKLREFLKRVQPPKPGEVNFMGLQAAIKEEGSLHITLLVRNGSDQGIKIESLPLIVEDASGEVVAHGGFNLEDFEVKAHTSKPWTFVFPASMIVKEQLDLSAWKAYPPQV
ncbi:accessory Sec system S-layer assembly protein [Heyndrickxia acidicola]|uniref:Accessory Sec system S-layer assembly protein n=1 Tax=Heyndrickxia acidicola TaxID=209389 RepID=A0ABU6ML41_9BACI|nr:accessory Sec system S-layer assembly protein [Heyndrickxia acidicola]MED1204358.1 accessory Sec system S-layer assembly protein [Heyndrickxia acidicola]